MFDLYGVSHLKYTFGSAWCYDKDTIDHGKRELVAKFLPEIEEGIPIEVYLESYPADFFIIKSNGKEIISTGSGMDEWVINTCKLLANGMVVVCN